MAAFLGVKGNAGGESGKPAPPGGVGGPEIGGPGDVGQLMAALGSDGDVYAGCAGAPAYDFAALKERQPGKNSE